MLARFLGKRAAPVRLGEFGFIPKGAMRKTVGLSHITSRRSNR